MVRKTKRRRLLARSTLLVIMKILTSARPISNRDLVEATKLHSVTVSQILKRLSNKGWLAPNLPSGISRAGQRRHPICYRLTLKGQQEAKWVLEKQGSLDGGRWQIITPRRGEGRAFHAGTGKRCYFTDTPTSAVPPALLR